MRRSGSDVTGARSASPQADPAPWLDIDLDELLREALEQITELLDAEAAVLLLGEDDGDTLALHAAQGLGSGHQPELRLPAGEGIARRLRDERRPVTVTGVRRGNGGDRLLDAMGVRSLLAVPLLADDDFAGLLAVGCPHDREFSDDDTHLLQLLANRVGGDIRQGGVFEHYRHVWHLQRSLLPERLPDAPGVAVAARYQTAATAAGLGGDWYDVVPLNDGCVGLAIGDVVGRGRKAATLMGELRNALRAYALEDDPPATVARKIERFMATLERGQMATMLYAVLDPEAAKVRFVTAGHPPPLIVPPDGEPRYAPHVAAPPVGVASGSAWTEVEVDLEPGATVVLYTDGLIERRGERLADGRDRLLHAAASGPRDPDGLVGHLIDELVGGGRPSDDVAVLAAQPAPVGAEELHLSFPAAPEELTEVRRVLRRWLAGQGAEDREIAAITLACQEACANAVEHAYGMPDGHFELFATRRGPEIEIGVRDRGRWRPARGEHRGRGMPLMRTLVHEVEISADDGGTTVLLRHRLGGVQ